MNEFLYGIKINGVCSKVEKITIDDDQTKYNYISKVFETSCYNGNGSYEISFMGTDFSNGLKIGDWKIISGYINYNWIGNSVRFKMEDNKGEVTKDISAGGLSSIDIPGFIERIIAKSMEFISEYPCAEIYNSMDSFMKTKSVYLPSLDFCSAINSVDSLEYKLKTIHEFVEQQRRYINSYKQLRELLSNSDNEKCIPLIGKLDQSFQERTEKTYKK